MTSTDGNAVTDSDTVAITVSPVNDAPVNTVPGAQVVNEDTALALGGISVNDVDGNLSTVQLGVTQGTVTVNLAGGATHQQRRERHGDPHALRDPGPDQRGPGDAFLSRHAQLQRAGYAHGDEHGRQCGHR